MHWFSGVCVCVVCARVASACEPVATCSSLPPPCRPCYQPPAGKFCKIINAEGVEECFTTEERGWIIRDGVVVVIKDSNIPDGTII